MTGRVGDWSNLRTAVARLDEDRTAGTYEVSWIVLSEARFALAEIARLDAVIARYRMEILNLLSEGWKEAGT